MTRTSIWDLREMRSAASPRKQSAQPPPIGSPRLARPSQGGNRRLSTIGRLAMRDRPHQAAHQAALYGHLSHLVPPPRVAESSGRLWPGRFSEACNNSAGTDAPRIAARKTETSPRSARGLGRSSSVPNGRPPPAAAARPPAMPTGIPASLAATVAQAAAIAAAAAAAAASATAASGYPPQPSSGSHAERETSSSASSCLRWTPPYEPVSYGPEGSTALEADLGAEANSRHHVPERRAHSQLSFVETVEDMLDGSIRPSRVSGRSGGERGVFTAVRAESADAAMSMQCWPEPSLQCRPAGTTPTPPPLQRPVPSPLGFDDANYNIKNALDAYNVKGATTNVESIAQDQLELYTEVAPDTSLAPGLGSIQPNGRAQVLHGWCSGPEPLAAALMQGAPAPGARQNVSRPLETLRSLLRPAQAPASGSMDPLEMEWSTLSDAGKQALKQWSLGQLGGRHCMLIVEHSVGNDTSLDVELPLASNLRGGAALNVLSGLQAEVELISHNEGGWLFEEVFAKPPIKVLEEAIAAALEEIGHPQLELPSDLSVEQANLALRRRAMKVQCASPKSKPSTGMGPRSSDEFTRMQVWLELFRQCAEGSKDGAQGGKPPKGERPPPPWNDAGVLRDIGKTEVDLEAESEKMSLDAIRVQNRNIEEYVMRLVRQRDELKSMAKFTEERDSYFILGLDGPESTEEEVKKAYRALARKEHPDKAGIGNKRRFQAIQHAYTSILRQRNEGGSLDVAKSPDKEQTPSGKAGAAIVPIREALDHSRRAKEAADRVGVCAHQAIKSNEDCAELQTAPKRRAIRALRDLTTRSIAELRSAANHLRTLGEGVCGVAACTEAVLNDLALGADKTVAGSGLRDRAIIVDDAGRSSLTSAELLDKISEATEATLRKVEKADAAPGSDAGPALARAGRDEAANLLRLGVRLLSESLTRTAAVARRSADEAIGAAVKGHELARGLVAVDLEMRKDREKTAAKNRTFDDEDDVIAAEDAARERGASDAAGEAPKSGSAEDAAAGKTPRANALDSNGGGASPRDQLKSAARRVKERHVALRVKNIRFLTSLNEEALRLQSRLRNLLERSEGALLPDVSVHQKKQVFDLVAQLLDFPLTELRRIMASPNVVGTPPCKVLEKVLSFALALEHSKEVAMPAESRTQALKLAALIDSDLLSQIIAGPFHARLVSIVGKRGGRNENAPVHGRLKVRSVSLDARGASSEMNVKAWTEAANACCQRIVGHIQALNNLPKAGDDAAAPLA